MSKAPAVDYALRIIEFFSEAQQEIGIADICILIQKKRCG